MDELLKVLTELKETKSKLKDTLAYTFFDNPNKFYYCQGEIHGVDKSIRIISDRLQKLTKTNED